MQIQIQICVIDTSDLYANLRTNLCDKTKSRSLCLYDMNIIWCIGLLASDPKEKEIRFILTLEDITIIFTIAPRIETVVLSSVDFNGKENLKIGSRTTSKTYMLFLSLSFKAKERCKR